MVKWTTKELEARLEKFCQSPEGASARVSLAVPMGFGSNPNTQFDIKKIDLIPNAIIGSKEKYRLVIVIQEIE